MKDWFIEMIAEKCSWREIWAYIYLLCVNAVMRSKLLRRC